MDDAATLLQTLAKSLGVPVENFINKATKDVQLLRSKEACELLDAFEKVDGYVARRRCIEFVKAEASGAWQV